MKNIELLKYPIGKPEIPKKITAALLKKWITIIELFPVKIKELTRNLSDKQLDTPYRQEGWTIRQVVHHCYDSHHNSYTRFKWTLTEDSPLIKAYDEKKWAALHDSKSAPIHLSINSLTSLHAKWVFLLRGMTTEDFSKSFIHPDGDKKVSLLEITGIYAWHCEHHFAHIFELIKRKNWL